MTFIVKKNRKIIVIVLLTIIPHKLNGHFLEFDDGTINSKLLFISLLRIQLLPGYIAYNFVIGAYSYWGPKAGYSIYHMVFSYAPPTILSY